MFLARTFLSGQLLLFSVTGAQASAEEGTDGDYSSACERRDGRDTHACEGPSAVVVYGRGRSPSRPPAHAGEGRLMETVTGTGIEGGRRNAATAYENA